MPTKTAKCTLQGSKDSPGERQTASELEGQRHTQ